MSTSVKKYHISKSRYTEVDILEVGTLKSSTNLKFIQSQNAKRDIVGKTMISKAHKINMQLNIYIVDRNLN